MVGAMQALLFAIRRSFGALALVAAGHATAHPEFFMGIAGSVRDPAFFTSARWIGANAVRLDAPWSQFEREPGRFAAPDWVERTIDGARKNGLEPVLILAYGNPLYSPDKPTTPEHRQAFARYAAWVVTHYRGRVRYFDLWNEWDTHTGRTTPGTPEDYIALARLAYPAMKRANPDAIVMSGGISDPALKGDWYNRFLASGGMKFIDALSIHPYNWNWRDDRSPTAAMSLVDEVHRKAVKARGRPVDVYVTEMGYPTHNGRFGLSEIEAACRLTVFFGLAMERPYIKGVWWYTIRDNGPNAFNKEHRFGLFSHDVAEAKAPAIAFRRISETAGGSRLPPHRLPELLNGCAPSDSR